MWVAIVEVIIEETMWVVIVGVVVRVIVGEKNHTAGLLVWLFVGLLVLSQVKGRGYCRSRGRGKRVLMESVLH